MRQLRGVKAPLGWGMVTKGHGPVNSMDRMVVLVENMKHEILVYHMFRGSLDDLAMLVGRYFFCDKEL